MTANRPEGHVPVAPAWTIGELPAHTAFSTAYVRGAGRAGVVEELREEFTSGPDTPVHLERARVMNTDDEMTVFLAYWTDPESQRRWRGRSQALTRPGVLLETAVFPAKRCETIYSRPGEAPGLRNLGELELTDVHEYWGATRDRIEDSTASELASEPGAPLLGNLCLVRGGEGWNCRQEEREKFFADVEPKLDAAIDYLANTPESGCIAVRYYRDQSLDGEDLESTGFTLWWRDLESVENWTRANQKHLDIYNSFVKMVIELGMEYDMQVWHELAVIPAGGVDIAGTETSPLLAAS